MSENTKMILILLLLNIRQFLKQPGEGRLSKINSLAISQMELQKAPKSRGHKSQGWSGSHFGDRLTE